MKFIDLWVYFICQFVNDIVVNGEGNFYLLQADLVDWKQNEVRIPFGKCFENTLKDAQQYFV